MSVKRLCLGLTLIAMIGIPERAQAEDDYGRPGFYLGAGLGFGFEKFEGTGGLDIDTGIGFDGWAGYRITPNFAAEIQLEYLDRFDFSADLGPPFGVVDFEGNFLAFTGNLKAYLMTGRVQPFAVVGIGVLRAELEALGGSISDTGFAARFGGGIDFYTTPPRKAGRTNLSIGATASYVLTTGDIDGLDYVSLVLGAQYRF